MGIKKLNKLLFNKDLIKYFTNLDSLLEYININNFGKRQNYIVVDTNIYLYKYLNVKDNDFYLILFKNQIKRFIKKNVIPIYVFESNSNDDKNLIINKRQRKKYKIKEQIEILKDIDLENNEEKINKLTKRFVIVESIHIQKLKDLFDSILIPYIEAPIEADFICSYLVKKNIAFGSLSDDMDLLVLGCKYLIKFSKGSYILYDYDYILKNLDINEDQFKNLAIFLGCDYCLSLNPYLDCEDVLHLVQNYDYEYIIRNFADIEFHSKYYPSTFYSTLSEIMNFSLFLDDKENIIKLIYDNFENAKNILKISNENYNIVSNINNYKTSILSILSLINNARN